METNYCDSLVIETYGKAIHVTGESQFSSGLAWQPPPLPKEPSPVDDMTDTVVLNFQFYEAAEAIEETMRLAGGR